MENVILGCITMEKKELKETDQPSPRAVGKIEGDSSEEDRKKHSVRPETQNVDCDSSEFGNDQRIGYDALKFDDEQHSMPDRVDEVIDVELNTHEERKDNVAGESHQENLETGTVPDDLFQKDHDSDSMEFGIEVSIVGQECSGVKTGSGDFEPERQEVSLDNFVKQGLFIEKDDSRSVESAQMNKKTESTLEGSNLEPDVGGAVVPGTEAGCSTSMDTLDTNPEIPRGVEKTKSLRDFVKEKSIIAVSMVLRRLSVRRDECTVAKSDNMGKDPSDLSRDSDSKEVPEKTGEKTTWNPLNYIKTSSVDAEKRIVSREEPINEGPPLPIPMKGRIIVYTRLGCPECKEVRKFLYMKRLRYVEINIDVFPSRKMELEKNSGSTSIPKVFFNGILIGGLSTLKSLNESGKLNEKIDYLINEVPSFECPVPPLSGEDDVSSRGALDEMALIVRKMKECIVVKDRFCKMRRFSNCFIASDAVNFLSEDQYLERKEVSLISSFDHILVCFNNIVYSPSVIV